PRPSAAWESQCALRPASSAPLLFLGGGHRLCFLEPVAGAGVQLKTVELFQVLYSRQGCGAEGTFAVEGMENNSFQQITEGHVEVLGQAFKHFQDALLHPHTGLHAFDEKLLNLVSNSVTYHGNNVP